MKILYFDCAMGASGDMLMGALYDLLGAEQKQEFLEKMAGLLPGRITVAAAPVTTGGIAATHMAVKVDGHEEEDHHHHHGHDHEHEHDHEHHHEHEHHHHHHHTTPADIAAIIDGMAVARQVKDRAKVVYGAIAAAEAAAHGCEITDIHFHEVGSLDAVADVVGVCLALDMVGASEVYASPIHVGAGTVKCAHGVLPVPTPATAALLRGMKVYGGEVMGELCTPTGAALLSCFATSVAGMPAMTVERIGMGAGTRQFDRPNILRAVVGERDGGSEAITELTCNIDDMTPEHLAFACENLLAEGALDVYTVAGTMKKGRSGWVLTVLCAPEKEQTLARAILRHTTTNGVRIRHCEKVFLRPAVTAVETPYGPVRVKTAEGFGIRHEKAEYSDAAALARKLGLPYDTVVQLLQKREEKA